MTVAGEKMPSVSLKDFCFSKEASLDSEFVGIHFNEGKFEIVFPLGFTPSSNDEKSLRKEILLLIKILRSYKNNDRQKSTEKEISGDFKDFPLSSYLFVFNYFLKNGYYRTRETLYAKNAKGKINWSRTIKQTNPAINNDNVVYLDCIARKTNYNDEELISIINKFCVYESFEKIGCLFTSFMPKNPHIKCKAKIFSSFLKRKIAETFNDEERLLFKNMLSIVEQSEIVNESKEYFFGTNEFHSVWEWMVDSAFGENDKERFYPKVYWKLFDEKGNFENAYDFPGDEKRNSLRPDTIMILNRGEKGQKIFVLDSKYYRYGVTGIKNHLPSSESIVKQLAYAEYIEKEESRIQKEVRQNLTENSIFNAFIMPFESKSEKPLMKNIGYASADYKFPIRASENASKKSYYKIYGILLDTKTLMQNHTKNDKNIEELARVIEDF